VSTSEAEEGEKHTNKIQTQGSFYNNNNSVQFFIIYVPSQQLQGQLQTQLSVDTSITLWTNTT
jgi:uncharacterized protein YlbG (UPF0298 family)